METKKSKKKIIIISSILAALAATVLVVILCLGPDVPKDPNEATAALSEAGYLDVRCESGTAVSAMINVGGLNYKVTGYKVDDNYDFIEIYYFRSDTDADEAWLSIQKLAYSESEAYRDDFVCEKSGAIIWFGTKAAVSAANGK